MYVYSGGSCVYVRVRYTKSGIAASEPSHDSIRKFCDQFGEKELYREEKKAFRVQKPLERKMIHVHYNLERATV